jgi:hypothetical protein
MKVYGEYAKAPEVTRRRLHIEAMERLGRARGTQSSYLAVIVAWESHYLA